MVGASYKYKNNLFNPKSYSIVCDVTGLSDKIGMANEDGSVPVDESIVDIIIKLNDLGFKTRACCSGLEADHNIFPPSAYIYFLDNKCFILEPALIKAGFEDVYHDGMTFYVAGSNSKRKKAWKSLEESVNNLNK